MTYTYHADAMRYPRYEYEKIETPFLVGAGVPDNIIESRDAFMQKAREASVNITSICVPHMEHYIRKRRDFIKLLAMQKADVHYQENANQLLKLANKASIAFKSQKSDLKKHVINLLISNCSHKDKTLNRELKPPGNMILELSKNRNWWS